MDIKPCPYCGGKAKVRMGQGKNLLHKIVKCESCGYTPGCCFMVIEDAIKEWNDTWDLKVDEWPFKPCPFCGKLRNQYVTEYSGVYEARCTCGAAAPGGDTEDEAMENWNRRPEMVLIPEGVDPNVFRKAIKKMADGPMKFITEDP